MKTSKFSTLLLTALIVTGCSTSINTPNTDTKSVNPSVNKSSEIKSNVALVKLTQADIVRLDHEYSAFSTKSLSAVYFEKKLVQLIALDSGVANGAKIVQELQYAKYKTETVIPFQAMSNADPVFYTTLTNVAAVIAQRTGDSPFDVFIGNSNPYPAIPGGLNATAITGTSFSANWNTVSGATAYEISVDGGAAVNVGNVLTYSATGLTVAANPHNFKVRAIKNTVTGSYSNPATSVTLVPPVTTISYTGGIVPYTVAAGITSLTITAKGAQGGSSGGLGATVTGTFAVTSGTTLNLLVGQQGSSGRFGSNGGGGGGTFVWNPTGTTLFIAAGGGGGFSSNGGIFGGLGSGTTVSTTGGGAGSGAGGSGGNGGAGGAGTNGTPGSPGTGGGGAGWLTNGANGTIVDRGNGGFSPLNGGAGGGVVTSATGCSSCSGAGGFGGGGSSVGASGASGGGGGYNGGGGGNIWNGSAWGSGGGGGSFNGGTSQTNTAGANSGDGQIIITAS